jgi:trehalose synthase
MQAFTGHVARGTDAHLLLAGPSVTSVADDPEQPEILRQLEEHWRQCDPELRRRVHVAQLPMDDEEENAAIVNAIQRHARVVVQKSLAEGFGLTVAEAMWKARPVVASRVGGIEDQIEHGRSGLLVDDPRDLAGFGRAVSGLLCDPPAAERLGKAARQRVCGHFLAPRHLIEQAALVGRLLG